MQTLPEIKSFVTETLALTIVVVSMEFLAQISQVRKMTLPENGYFGCGCQMKATLLTLTTR